MLKIKGILLILPMLVLILTSVMFSEQPAKANDLMWSRVNTPSNGQAGRWVLAAGSDIDHLTQTPDGTLYCTANPSATEYRLFKSSDGGYSWSYSGKVKDDIVDIAVLPDNSSVVYYATSNQIFESFDSAYTFTQVSPNPFINGNGQEITSLDVSSDNTSRCIVVSTRNVLSEEYGGVYFLKQGQVSQWTNLGIGNRDVYCAAFSPNYVSDGQIITVSCDENDTLISTNLFNSGWNQTIGDAGLDNITIESACISFPEDYDSDPDQGNYLQYVALDSGQGKGGVFELRGRAAPAFSTLTCLNKGALAEENQDISSLAVSGNSSDLYLLAGAADKSEVYLSADSGNSWTISHKAPSGGSNTQVLIAADFELKDLAYAASAGSESAFSISRDKGETWDQTGLIDTAVNRILDLAVSPEYEVDDTLLLLTADILNSLWLSSNRGTTWERVLAPNSSDRINLILLSPRFGSNRKVFLAGISDLVPTIWKSENSGRNFLKMPAVDNGKPLNIDAWAITPDDTLLLGSYDNNTGLIYTFDGTNFIDVSEVGSKLLNSIVVSPDFSHDKTVLAGDILGGIYYSTDSGYMFEPLPMNTESSPFSGVISAAFDPEFEHNQTIYAADDTPDKGIYRFIFGKSASWERIDTTLPSGGSIGRVVIDSRGILYGLNSQEVGTSSGGGIERCLNPSESVPLTFESITSGLNAGVSLQNLWIKDNILWAIDANNSDLWTYTDTLGTSVIPLSPQDGSSGLVTRNVTISWKTLEGASSYEWQVDTYPEFTDPLEKFKGASLVASKKLPALDTNTTYYWRVRANGPILSPWSKTRYFKTTNKTGSSGGSSGGSNSTKPSPTPTPTAKPTPSPAPEPSPTPIKTTTSEIAPQKTADPSPAASPSSAPPTKLVTTIIATPQSLQSTPAPSVEPESNSLNSLIRLIAILVGGLIVLSIILLVVVISVLKKFKTRY
jgi:hypothetical protein